MPSNPDTHPGDEAPEGAIGTGEVECPQCQGSGNAIDGGICPNCEGTGKVVQGIGGG